MAQLTKQGDEFGYIEVSPGEPGVVMVDDLICHLWIKNRNIEKEQIMANMCLEESIRGAKFPEPYLVLIVGGRYEIVKNTALPETGGFLIGFKESDIDEVNAELNVPDE